MMTWTTFTTRFAAGVAALGCLPATQESTQALALAESAARARLDDGTLHGGVALVERGAPPRTLFSGRTAYPDGVEIDGSTRFRIASLTKVITRIAILKLAQEDRLALDDPLARYRPGLKSDWAERITLRQLLSFRSGLPRERSGAADPVDAGVTFDEDGRGLAFLDGLTEDGPTIEPDTRVLYSNLGYFHLGGVLESVTGQSVATALQDLVFAPAGMRATSLGDRHLTGDEALAVGHRTNEDGARVPVPDFPIAPRYTAGGLVSTVDDLVSLSVALLEGRLLSEESYELLLTEFGNNQDHTFRVAGLVPGFAGVWSLSAQPATAVVLLNNAVGANPGQIVAAHDEIAAKLRSSTAGTLAARPDRAKDGWKSLRSPSDWPEHQLMNQAKLFFAEAERGDADDLYKAGLAVRGENDADIDEESRDVYRWMASYHVALRDRYGPFALSWWRPGESGAFEFLFEGPESRALRIKLRPSASDPSVTSTLSIATMGFDADSSLYEGMKED